METTDFADDTDPQKLGRKTLITLRGSANLCSRMSQCLLNPCHPRNPWFPSSFLGLGNPNPQGSQKLANS
jgi:hypothetical protein